MIDISVLTEENQSQEWIGEQSDNVSKKLIAKSNTLVELLEVLGPALTNQKASIRVSGVQLVSGVLARLPEDFLPQEDAGLLIAFYTDRLRDHHSLLPSTLRGLASLGTMKNITRDHLTQLLARLFQEVVVQQQVVGDRTVIYSLLSQMLTTRLEDVKSFQAEFTGHLLQAMEGEKDPRNLLVVFSCVEVILNTLDIPDQHEEVFESLAVYFPVDYRPPGGGKSEGVVTKEQLVMGLRQPISHPKLLEFSLPLFLDKSEAELDSAKVDSLECLLACAARSDGGSVGEWGKQVEDVWQALKRESMGISRLQPSQDIISATLKAVTGVSACLGGGGGGLATPTLLDAWDKWMRGVWSDCKPHLSQPATRLMAAAGDVLAAVAKSGRVQAKQVLGYAVPELVKTWQGHTGGVARQAIVGVANDMMLAAAGTGLEAGEEAWLDEMLAVYLHCVGVGEGVAVEAGMGMARAANMLSQGQRKELCDCLLGGVEAGQGELGGALAQLAEIDVDLVKTRVVPRLLELSLDEAHQRVVVSAVSRLWGVGLAGELWPKLINHVADGKYTAGTAAELFRIMALYKLSSQDKIVLGNMSGELLASLIQWPARPTVSHVGGQFAASYCQVLAKLAELVPEDRADWVTGCFNTPDLSDAGVLEEVGAVVSSVRPVLVKGLGSVLDTVIGSQVEGEVLWRLRASLVNKDPGLAERLRCEETVEGVRGAGWVAVGLVKRGRGEAGPWLEKLFAALENDDLGEEAVTAFSRLLSSTSWGHQVTSLLYKQRLWETVCPRLVSSSSTSTRHLAALVLLLPSLPRPLLTPRLSTLLPLVTKALSSPSTSFPALTCLSDLLSSSPSLLSDHMLDIVPHCLTLCAPTSPLPTRRLALSVIGAISASNNIAAVQLAPQVTRGLESSLADNKRVVRKEAVLTINTWFLVTQP